MIKKRKIKVNKAQCLICGDILESKHRHDFKTCKCGNLSVDGGKDYLRRAAKDPFQVKDLSEMEDEDEEETIMINKFRTTINHLNQLIDQYFGKCNCKELNADCPLCRLRLIKMYLDWLNDYVSVSEYCKKYEESL